MSGVLIDDIEFLMEFHQPVSIKELTYDPVFFDMLFGKLFFLKVVHLFWWFW